MFRSLTHCGVELRLLNLARIEAGQLTALCTTTKDASLTKHHKPSRLFLLPVVLGSIQWLHSVLLLLEPVPFVCRPPHGRTTAATWSGSCATKRQALLPS